MATNIATTLRTAIAGILNADTTVRTLTGRTSKNVVRWNALAAATRPVYALLLVTNTRTGGDGDRREILAQLSAIAEGDDALTKAEALAQRARETITVPALITAGLDVIDVGPPDERSSEDDDEAIPGYARVDLDLPITVTAP